jgi:hypothetical protein
MTDVRVQRGASERDVIKEKAKKCKKSIVENGGLYCKI